MPPGLKVVEVGSDYIVMQNITGLDQIRIPIYAIRIIRVNLIGRGG